MGLGKKIFRFLCIIIFFQPIYYITLAQDIKIGMVDASNYPDMELSFIATYPNGEKNFSLQVKDFEVAENSQKTLVTEVINPNGEGRPVSVVLVFDVSASMNGERLALAKEAALGFFKQFPLETSEAAIASFSDNVYVNCDFTQDKTRLTEAISNLETFRLTSYSTAFLFDQSGALDLAKKGKYKKAIVFLTDGLSSANTAEIIKRATTESVSIYCISLELRMPDILKDISIKTGGRYYEAITNIYQLHNFYASICQLLQTSGTSILRWKALTNCEKKRKVKLYCQSIPYEFTYEVPAYKMGYLTADPNAVYFGKPENSNPTASININAVNHSLIITDISNSRNEHFSVKDSLHFPFQLNPERKLQVNIDYLFKDAGVITDNLIVTVQGCPNLRIPLNGGEEEKLRLIYPSGGEVFPVGMDTIIAWEGIRREKFVTLSYRTAENKPWKKIVETNGLNYKWTIPNDTGVLVQVKAEPLFTDERNFKVKNRFTSVVPVVHTYINNDGSRLITVDNNGTLRFWDGNTSKMILTLGGFQIKQAMLSPDSKRIIGFTGFEMFVWDAESFKLIARYTFRQKMFISDVDADGNESLLSTRIYKDINDKVKAWSPGSNVLIPLPDQKDVTAASLNQNGLRSLTLNSDNYLKLWDVTKNTEIGSYNIGDVVSSVIISPNGQYFAINLLSKVRVYNINTGNEQFAIDNNNYQQFSSTDEVLVTKSGIMLNFWDSKTGKRIYKLTGSPFYKLIGSKLLYYKHDSLKIADLKDETYSFSLKDPDINEACISPDGSLLIIARKGTIIDFYDLADKKKFNSLSDFDAQIMDLKFSEDGKNIVGSLSNYETIILKPYINKKLTEVVSGYFSIVSPAIKVKDTIFFKDQFVNEPNEKIISGFIVNRDNYPVSVSKMEVTGEDTGDFELVSQYCPVSVSGKSVKDLECRFTPKTIGMKKAFIKTVTATDTFYTLLIGKGISKGFEILTKTIDFGGVLVGKQKDTVSVVIRNTGSVALIVDELIPAAINKDIYTYQPLKNKIIIAPGEDLPVTLSFVPKVRGRVSGLLEIKIKDVPNVQTINLFGEGIAKREITVIGKTLDNNSKSPVSAKVSCFDLLSGIVVQKYSTNTTGYYAFKLNTDRNYGLMAEKNNFIAGSENIDLSGVIQYDTIHRDIYLTEIKSGAIIRMNCIFFDFAKWNLLESSKTELNRLADILNQNPKIAIEIHGHTDSIGNAQSNIMLSKNRANAVREYLLEKGIAPSRLTILYFGESMPVSTNSTDIGRAQNRRVEVKIK
jgi:outer membrane protein OmpA-like peptidoglycan-associated protein/WD40 repeat protein